MSKRILLKKEILSNKVFEASHFARCQLVKMTMGIMSESCEPCYTSPDESILCFIAAHSFLHSFAHSSIQTQDLNISYKMQ